MSFTPSIARTLTAALAGGLVAWLLDVLVFGDSAAAGAAVAAVVVVGALGLMRWSSRRRSDDSP